MVKKRKETGDDWDHGRLLSLLFGSLSLSFVNWDSGSSVLQGSFPPNDVKT